MYCKATNVSYTSSTELAKGKKNSKFFPSVLNEQITITVTVNLVTAYGHFDKQCLIGAVQAKIFGRPKPNHYSLIENK